MREFRLRSLLLAGSFVLGVSIGTLGCSQKSEPPAAPDSGDTPAAAAPTAPAAAPATPAPASTAPVPTTPATPASPPPAAAPVASPVEPAPAPEPKAVRTVHEANLLPNASFELRDKDGRPNGWAVSPLDAIDMKAKGTAYDGKEFLAVKGDKQSVRMIATTFKIPKDTVGRTLVLEGAGKVPKEGAMSLSIERKNGEAFESVAKRYWPASESDWAMCAVNYEVPEDAPDAEYRVLVMVLKGDAGVYRVDGLKLYVPRVSNASVESRDKDGRPFGWGVSPAEILDDDTKSSVKPRDAQRMLALKGLPDSWGIAITGIALTEGDLGKTLIVSAWGQSPAERHMKLDIFCEVDGKRRMLTTQEAGWWGATGGEWKQAIVEVTLPADTDPSKVSAMISTRPGTDVKYLVDHLQASVQ